MDYKKALKEISSWAGLEKAYHEAVAILQKHNRISPIELKTLKQGRNCYNDDLIIQRMKELRTELEAKLPKEPEIKEPKKIIRKLKTEKEE